MLAAAALLVAAVLLPPLQALLDTGPLTAQGWGWAATSAVAGWVCARVLSRTKKRRVSASRLPPCLSSPSAATPSAAASSNRASTCSCPE